MRKNEECPKCKDVGQIRPKQMGVFTFYEYCDCMAAAELEALTDNYYFDIDKRESALRTYGYRDDYEEDGEGGQLYCLYKDDIQIEDIAMYIVELEKRLAEKGKPNA